MCNYEQLGPLHYKHLEGGQTTQTQSGKTQAHYWHLSGRKLIYRGREGQHVSKGGKTREKLQDMWKLGTII